MKKVKILLWSLFSLCFLWVVINAGVWLLAPEYEIFIGTQGDFTLIQRVLNVAALFSGFALAVLYYMQSERQTQNKITLVFTGIELLALTLSSNFVFAIFDVTNYHSFTSPDAAHTIVVGEYSFLQGGGVRVYERVNSFLIRLKDRAVTDDGHRPICDGTYHITWYENGACFSFSDGEGGLGEISLNF